MGSIAGEIPIMAAFDGNGEIIVRPDRGSVNILAVLENEDLNMRYMLNGNFYADVSLPFIEGLNYRAQYSQSIRFTRAYRFEYTGNTDQGLGYKNYTFGNSFTFDNIVSYRRNFGSNHSVNATFVYGVEKRVNDATNSQANNFTDMALYYNKLGAGQADLNTLTSSAWEETSLYWMGRAIYTFKDRYVATATIRHDGYSGFGDNHKTGNFPSLALAWRISEEDFFKNNINLFNDLKLRMSYGTAGNRPPGRYVTMSQMAVYNPFRGNSATNIDRYLFGDGATPQLVQAKKTLPNPDLRWETTATFNLGVDFSVINGRLSGNYEFYHQKTSDLIYNISVPSINGAFTSETNGLDVQVATNVGEMRNMGHEISITGVPIARKNFHWAVTGNFAINFNEVVSIFKGDADRANDDLINAKIFIGHPFGVHYDYNIIGMWQLDDYYAGRIPNGAYFGTYKVEDLDGDGDLKPETDRKIIGYEAPLYSFNIRSALRYKQFDFSFIINSIQGGKKRYLGRPMGNGFGENNMDYFPNVKHDWWMPENPNARYKRISHVDARVANLTPYVSRSFIRLQNISLAYNLPASLLKKVAVNRARVFINGDNLFCITDWDGWDPETGHGLSNSVTYPPMKSYSIGVNFEF
jgi:TonB-linked SusC/RagA family outer membrane protein